MEVSSRTPTIVALGCAQTLAWASSYYLLAILAAPIARDLGVSVPTVFGAFSVALLVSAALGPYGGRSIDRWGGRPVLMTTSVVFAAGLAALGLAHGTIGLFVAWAILGIAMGSGLYEAAFAALVRLYGTDSRNAITGITLFAGFASTVGWPLSTLLESQLGWRGACFAWASLHIVIGLPLNWSLPRGRYTHLRRRLYWKTHPDLARLRPAKDERPGFSRSFSHRPGSSALRWLRTFRGFSN